MKHEENNTYRLKNILNEEMADRYTRSRLKALKETQSTDNFYNVERILDSRKARNGAYEYLVKWEGLSKSHNSWDPEEHFADRTWIRKFWENKYLITNDRK